MTSDEDDTLARLSENQRALHLAISHLAADGLSTKPLKQDDWEYLPRQTADKFTDGERWYIP